MDPRATRHSARLQQASRPSYSQVEPLPQAQGHSQSPFTSSSSLASMSSVDTTTSRPSPIMGQQQQSQQQSMFRPDSAPMPSPSQSRMEQSNPFDAFGLRHQQAQSQHLQQQQQQSGGQAYNTVAAAARGSPETESFLSNLNLVAEAAKRAQMACLMRDFGDVEL